MTAARNRGARRILRMRLRLSRTRTEKNRPPPDHAQPRRQPVERLAVHTDRQDHQEEQYEQENGAGIVPDVSPLDDEDGGCRQQQRIGGDQPDGDQSRQCDVRRPEKDALRIENDGCADKVERIAVVDESENARQSDFRCETACLAGFEFLPVPGIMRMGMSTLFLSLRDSILFFFCFRRFRRRCDFPDVFRHSTTLLFCVFDHFIINYRLLSL